MFYFEPMLRFAKVSKVKLQNQMLRSVLEGWPIWLVGLHCLPASNEVCFSGRQSPERAWESNPQFPMLMFSKGSAAMVNLRKHRCDVPYAAEYVNATTELLRRLRTILGVGDVTRVRKAF